MRIPLFKLLSSFALTFAACDGQTISTFAGAYNPCSTADGATTSTVCIKPSGMVFDSSGNLYYADQNSTVRKISAQGIVTTVAGSTYGYSGDGGPATKAQLTLQGGAPGLSGLALDANGHLYISDTHNCVIRMVNLATNVITTVAGNTTCGYTGDGVAATKTSLQSPSGIAVDSAGNLYIADVLNNRVRKVDSNGVISTVAGNGNATYSGDGVQANTTSVVSPNGVAFDSAGNLYISESNRIRKVDTSGVIATIAGATSRTGTSGFSGDGGPATAALLAGPVGMVADATGNLYFADANNERIRKIDTGGNISTYAGKPGNVSTPLGDGGPAASAYLGMTRNVIFDAAGNLLIAASPGQFDDIRKVTAGLGLGANPGALTFTSAVGSAAPPSQTVNLTSTGSALNFTAATSGGNWLSVTPTSGTTPASLTVSVNPASMGPGTYQGQVTVSPTGATAVTVPVTLTVTGAGAPVLSTGGIVNATGYQTTLAPDTVFVIFGSNMGPAALTGATAPNYPSSLGGTSITFTPSAGGAAITAKMVYSSAGQVAALLPSSITPGTYAVQLTYNNQTSAPQTVTVVARSFGIATSNSAGTGAAQATIGNVNGGVSLVRLTSGSLSFNSLTWTLTPAHPGDTLVLWGTGGGADSANDTGGSSGDQTAAGKFSVSVDGTAITPQYAGTSSGYPGLWQINFTLPASITPDCFASVQVSAAGQLSNSVTIAIAPAGQTSCSSQISPSTLSKLDSGSGTIVFAGMVIGRSTFSTGATETVGGVFNRYSAAEFLIPYTGPKVDQCFVLDQTYPAGAKEPSAADAQLDAGTIKISGPGLSSTVGVFAGASGPAYSTTLPNGTLKDGGTYTMTGSGGTQVGPFTASATMPSGFAVTNQSSLSTIHRGQPLPVSWTGTGFDLVIIHLQSAVLTTTTTHGVVISCAVPAGLGTYTIPAAAVGYIPSGATVSVSVSAQPSGGGIASAESATTTSLTPTLVGGGTVDFGAFTPYVSVSVNATLQ